MIYVAVCAFSVSSALQAQWVEEPSYLCVQYLVQDMPRTLLRALFFFFFFFFRRRIGLVPCSSYQTIANQIASACVPCQYRVRVLEHRYNYTLSSMLVQSAWSCAQILLHTEHSDNTVLLPLRHLLAHAATTGTIFCFTCLSAAKSACHDYMNVFPASHCRTYYNTKLLQQSASSWLLTVFGPDAATTTTIAPATHRWCWLLSSRHRPLSK